MQSGMFSRRAFLSSSSRLIALGGGLYYWSSTGSGQTAEEIRGELTSRGFVWPPPSPRRLSADTHLLAQRALSGEFGRAMQGAQFSLNEERVLGMSANMRYAEATRLVAERAPLRILPDERLVGSATLLEAPYHSTPVVGCLSTSHTTIGFDRGLALGYRGLRQEIEEQRSTGDEPQCRTTTGRWDRAFDGSPDGQHWIEARAMPAYGQTPLTVECWARVRSVTGHNILLAHHVKESRNHWELFACAGNGHFCAYWPGQRAEPLDSGRTIADGQWHFLAMTHDGVLLRLFVDGQLAAEASMADTGIPQPLPGPLYIGGYPPQGLAFDGLIDEVRLSSVARSGAPVPSSPLTIDSDTLTLWHFDENCGQGLYRDCGSLNNPGVPISDGRSALASCATAAGNFGRALSPNGALAGHAWAPGRSEYDQPPLTVECWAKLTSKAGFNILIANRTKASRHHWELYSIPGSGNFSAYLPGYTPSAIEAPHDIVDNRWHHLAMTHDGSRIRLYVDGQQRASVAVAVASGMGDGDGSLVFGAYPLQSLTCSGQIDEVRISTSVRAFSGTPATPFSPDSDTVGLWHFDETQNERLYADSSRLANHAFAPAATGSGGLVPAMLACLDAAKIWHQRYLDQLDQLAASTAGEQREHYLRVRQALQNVPENPPTSFHEAVQSLWFMYAFQRLMGNWSGIGRIDKMLGPYLAQDLNAGRITLDEAREILAHFWIKGCEWIGALGGGGSGDAQHYQNIILSGVDAQGNDVTNDVTYLVLDVVEELHISDFPIAVRINARTPDRLLWRIAEIQRQGGGIVAVYNEEVVIDALVRFGYPLAEARGFTNDGCWEPLIPGKTAFTYHPLDLLNLLHEILGLSQPPSAATTAFPDFEALYSAFLQQMATTVDGLQRHLDMTWRSGLPAPLLSIFVEGCLTSGKGYHDCGARHTVIGIHGGGLANVANSLLAIKRAVFDDQLLSLAEFVRLLRLDWQGGEHLRQYILNRVPAYGNDDDAADAMAVRVFDDFATLVEQVRERNGIKRPCGISTFGREIIWSMPGGGRAASPDGHHKGEILATNCSPSPGTDRCGPTAALNSYAKLDFSRAPSGATIELKIHPDSVAGQNGLAALVALMRGFVAQRGMFMHIDVIDTAMLRDAQAHPEKYPNLSVRVAGWSARFATLAEIWQQMIINRTQQFMSTGSGQSAARNWRDYT